MWPGRDHASRQGPRLDPDLGPLDSPIGATPARRELGTFGRSANVERSSRSAWRTQATAFTFDTLNIGRGSAVSFRAFRTLRVASWVRQLRRILRPIRDSDAWFSWCRRRHRKLDDDHTYRRRQCAPNGMPACLHPATAPDDYGDSKRQWLQGIVGISPMRAGLHCRGPIRHWIERGSCQQRYAAGSFWQSGGKHHQLCGHIGRFRRQWLSLCRNRGPQGLALDDRPKREWRKIRTERCATSNPTAWGRRQPQTKALRAQIKLGADALGRGDFTEVNDADLEDFLEGLTTISAKRVR